MEFASAFSAFGSEVTVIEFMKGGIFEREPVAMMICSASICSPFTSTTWSETKRASQSLGQELSEWNLPQLSQLSVVK